jgi:hypothetical protein
MRTGSSRGRGTHVLRLFLVGGRIVQRSSASSRWLCRCMLKSYPEIGMDGSNDEVLIV